MKWSHLVPKWLRKPLFEDLPRDVRDKREEGWTEWQLRLLIASQLLITALACEALCSIVKTIWRIVSQWFLS